MRITFEMSGGYAGMFVARPLHYVVDTARTDAATAAEIEALVRDAGIFDLDAAEAQSNLSHLPGVYEYRLTVVDAARTVTLHLDDTNAPASARPLLQYLQSKGIEERMRDG
jgi:hypothetical protein